MGCLLEASFLSLTNSGHECIRINLNDAQKGTAFLHQCRGYPRRNRLIYRLLYPYIRDNILIRREESTCLGRVGGCNKTSRSIIGA